MKKKRASYETVDLTKKPLGVAELRELCRKLGQGPREILRAKDPAYAENDLATGRHSDAALFELMAANPGLIQRPIVVRGKKAVVARPVENIQSLLD